MKKPIAVLDPTFVARSSSDELKWPIIKTKNVSRADKAGVENDENIIATAVRIVSSRNISKIAAQIGPVEPPAADIKQRERHAGAHYCDIDEQRQAQAKVLADDEFAAADRL